MGGRMGLGVVVQVGVGEKVVVNVRVLVGQRVEMGCKVWVGWRVGVGRGVTVGQRGDLEAVDRVPLAGTGWQATQNARIKKRK
jgi:hypothetical protein